MTKGKSIDYFVLIIEGKIFETFFIMILSNLLYDCELAKRVR